MKRIISRIEDLNISFWYVIAIFFFSIMIRGFFENFVTTNQDGRLNGFSNIFLHYPLWYLAVFFALVGIITLFSSKKMSKVFNLVSIGSFIIILPTIVDLIFYHEKIEYNYIVGTWSEVFREYYTLLVSNTTFGLGIKLEIYIVICAIFYYIYSQKKNFLKALFAALLSYTFIFLMLILPNIVYLFTSFFVVLPEASVSSIRGLSPIVEYYKESEFPRVYISDIINNSVRRGPITDLGPIMLAQASLYILIFVSTCLTALNFGWNKFKYFSGNFRWLRIFHYFMLLIFGLSMGIKAVGSTTGISNMYDWLALSSALFSLLFAWLYAVWENDEVDRGIDELSNSDRPLVRGIFSAIEWENIKKSFLALSIVSAILSGYSTLIVIIVFSIFYHIYSVYPLRLKRYPVISSTLIALNACLAFLIGFFLVSGNKPFDILPLSVLSGLFLFYLCVENIKNLKDIAGDRKDNILTIPVIFGDKKGKIITWLLVFAGSFAIPFIILPNKSIALLGPVFGALSYFLIARENYKEKPLMLFYLIGFSIILFI